MNQRLWGAIVWRLIHYICFQYRDTKQLDYNTKANLNMFLYSLSYVIPCIHCRASMKTFICVSNFEKVINQNNDLFEWSYAFHEMVNRKLWKKRCPRTKYTAFVSFEEVEEKWRHVQNLWPDDIFRFYTIVADKYTVTDVWTYLFFNALGPLMVGTGNKCLKSFMLPDDVTYQHEQFSSTENLQKLVARCIDHAKTCCSQ